MNTVNLCMQEINRQQADRLENAIKGVDLDVTTKSETAGAPTKTPSKKQAHALIKNTPPKTIPPGIDHMNIKPLKTVAPKYTRLRAIERQILELEGVSVVFRADESMLVPGEGYNFTKKLAKNSTLSHLIARIERALKGWKGTAINYVIIKGDGKHAVMGKTAQPLAPILRSYEKKV